MHESIQYSSLNSKRHYNEMHFILSVFVTLFSMAIWPKLIHMRQKKKKQRNDVIYRECGNDLFNSRMKLVVGFHKFHIRHFVIAASKQGLIVPVFSGFCFLFFLSSFLFSTTTTFGLFFFLYAYKYVFLWNALYLHCDVTICFRCNSTVISFIHNRKPAQKWPFECKNDHSNSSVNRGNGNQWGK